MGRFVSTGGAKIINLPFQPDHVRFINQTKSAAAATSQNVVAAEWFSSMGQGTAVQQGYNATPAFIYDYVSANGISTFSAGLSLQYGPVYQHTGSTDFSITAATPPVVTTTTAHGLTSGDVVIFSNLAQTSTTGMQQMAGIPFTVTVTSTTQFSIPWIGAGSNYTAFNSASSTGNVGSFKKVLYPYLYFPGEAIVQNITLGTTTTVDTTTAHNYVVGQEVAFRIPSTWGTTQLNSLPNVVIPGSPIYGYVISVTDYNTFVVSIDSSAYTAFNANQTFAGYPGRTFAQVVAVGDVNTGGVQISANSVLYPPPYFSPIGTTRVDTINGPAIQGAFVNNTSQGFVIGIGAGGVLTTSVLVGATNDVIYWEAELHDMNLPR